MQEHGQLYVYEHRCICCTSKFQTINPSQLTCSPKCFLIWEDPEQYIRRHVFAGQESEGDKPDFLDLFFG